MQEKQIIINKNTYKSVWLTISVPENTDPGLYTTSIKVKSSLGEQSIPLKLTVYPLTLPSKRHLDVVEWFSTSGFSKWHGINEEYSLGTQFSWINPKQRGQEITARVIKDFEDYSNDPDVLNAAKMEVIKELLMFDTSPKVYIQTRPFEGSGLFRQASTELFVWCEPGTKININRTTSFSNNSSIKLFS